MRIQSRTCFFTDWLLIDNVMLEENISPWFQVFHL